MDQQQYQTRRVRYTGPVDQAFPYPHAGQLGTLFVGMPAERNLRRSSETREKRAQLDSEFARTHSMIRWDGHRFPWSCENSQFEYLDENL